MRLLIKFPTRNRVQKFISTLNKYRTLLSGKHNVKFVISCDIDDPSMNNQKIIGIIKNLGCDIRFSANRNKIEAINADMGYYDRKWDILLLASDDMIPVIKEYDDIIISQMKKKYPNTDGILFFNDGYKKQNLNTLCILGYKYYKRFNYIYNPNYFSIWCDYEFMKAGEALNRQSYISDVIIKHEHPINNRTSKDALYKKNSKFNKIDRAIWYNRRKIVEITDELEQEIINITNELKQIRSQLK
jgi:hypothetical protein